MSVKFCSSCGSKFEYKYSPPKFCSNCGEPVGGISKSRPNENAIASAAAERNRKISQINDSETDAEYVPKINKIDFEIEDYSTATTIGDLFGRSSGGGRRRQQTKSMEDFLDRGRV